MDDHMVKQIHMCAQNTRNILQRFMAAQNAAESTVESEEISAPNSAVKSTTDGVPVASPGATQTVSSVTITSPVASTLTSLTGSATAHDDEHAQAMDLETREFPPPASSNSDEFTTVVKRQRNRQLSQAAIERLDRTVYMSGHQVNLAQVIAIDQAAEFQRAIDENIGPVNTIEVIRESIKITCSSTEQKDKFLELVSILGHDVKVTLPHCMTKTNKQEIMEQSNTSSTWTKGVIKTPLHFDQDFIKAHSGAIWTHRITVKKDGKIIQTPSVILAFEGSMPEKIKIGLYAFSVQPYIPKPIRCAKCQRYGHKTRDCRKTFDTCPRCAGKHSISACNSDNLAVKCINCGGNHSAAYKGCIKYKSIATALKSTVTEGLTYSEALKKSNRQLRQDNVSNQPIKPKHSPPPQKQDSSTQTEIKTHTTTQTEIPNDDLAEILKATVDAVNWLLSQIKVTSNQKPLLEALRQQYGIFTDMFEPQKPSPTLKTNAKTGATKNVPPKRRT
jgi:hypothetical protein